MKKLLSLSLALLIAGLFNSLPAVRAQETPAVTATAKPALTFGLTADTPIKLRINRTMTSATAKVDEKVDFDVIEEVKIGDVVVVPQGAKAIATVTEAHPKRRLGRSGKLNINIDYVQLASGDKVNLRAVKGGNGGNHVGAMTGAMVATGIVFFPAAPLFLFMKGKNITIPKGTEITAYVAADTPLDPARFASTQASSTASTTQSQPGTIETPALSTVIVKSNPDGAEITIGGKFVGSTPSTLQLGPGEHTIVIEKSGYKSWQRTMVVSSGGSITVDATLEKAQ